MVVAPLIRCCRYFLSYEILFMAQPARGVSAAVSKLHNGLLLFLQRLSVLFIPVCISIVASGQSIYLHPYAAANGQASYIDPCVQFIFL